ncbi:hypothetical protein B9Z55_024907 [Caenorhabditis nigoni]|nr:hypothetical protein B9Z55_024907 [Caenorhabditis nigoni]
MPPFRERLGTGCTKDSKDSGIEVRPKAKRHRNRHRARMQTRLTNTTPSQNITQNTIAIEPRVSFYLFLQRFDFCSARKKPISSTEEQVADNRQEDARRYAENSIVIGLWLVVLYVTNLTFGLPLKIMWPARINHAAVALSYLLIGIWVLCAIYFYIRKRSDDMRWHKTYPKTYYFAWMIQLMGFALFCLATYPQIHRWSLLVSIFYFSFFATISNTFL